MKDPSKALSFLLGTKVELDAGCGGYYEIVLPPGEIATTTLVERNDVQSLRTVLAKGSLEAQVLALRGLKELNALGERERSVIRSLRRSKRRVHVCAGDIGGRTEPVQDYIE
jgi:hypothetical protein